ncbi:MAG: secondary thiamine-phosphate synthase enzyme YjbQ [Candidatus Anstonellales archaeon]
MFSKKFLYTLDADEVIDITHDIKNAVEESKIKNGICNVFAKGSTAALILSEYEHGHIKDLFNAMEIIAPSKNYYEHDKAWHDGNGKSHIRAAFLQQHLTMPLINKRLEIGQWQNILLINLDTRKREREVLLSILEG